jgi:hypothetical protein
MADTEYTQGFRAGQANEQERIINAITDFSLQFASDSKTPLEKMVVENYQMFSLFIVGLIKDEVENFIPNAIALIKKGNK